MPSPPPFPKRVARAAVMAIALSSSLASAGAAAQRNVAPPVMRKPAAKPAERAADPAPGGCAVQGAAPCPLPTRQAAAAQPAQKSPETLRRALEAVAPANGRSDPALQGGLLTTLSRLMAAGRCTEASALASGNRQPELAGAVQRLCAAP